MVGGGGGSSVRGLLTSSAVGCTTMVGGEEVVQLSPH